jgi:hypothetical protein
MDRNFLLLIKIWQSMQSLTKMVLVSREKKKKYDIGIELRFDFFAAVKFYIMDCFIRLHNLVKWLAMFSWNPTSDTSCHMLVTIHGVWIDN